MTIFGEMKLPRKLYEDRVTGKTRFLLDDRLGLEKSTCTLPGFHEWLKYDLGKQDRR